MQGKTPSPGHRASEPTIPAPESGLAAFDYDPRTRVVFGSGTINRLGELAAEFGDRVLLVSDKGLKEARHEDRAVEALKSAGLLVTVYDVVQLNPTTDDARRDIGDAREQQPTVMVSVGGGSSIDCAKL